MGAGLPGDLHLARAHAAALVKTQRDRLPAGTSLASFDRETAKVSQLLEALAP